MQAFEKLCRGEFSISPRVSTFLFVASRYQCFVRHAAGSAILPSDFAIRNAPACNDRNCQIRTFVQKSEDSVVRRTSLSDVFGGNSKLPYTTRSSWLSLQEECSDLRRVYSHLKQGTRPSKKRQKSKTLSVIEMSRLSPKMVSSWWKEFSLSSQCKNASLYRVTLSAAYLPLCI